MWAFEIIIIRMQLEHFLAILYPSLLDVGLKDVMKLSECYLNTEDEWAIIKDGNDFSIIHSTELFFKALNWVEWTKCWWHTELPQANQLLIPFLSLYNKANIYSGIILNVMVRVQIS